MVAAMLAMIWDLDKAKAPAVRLRLWLNSSFILEVEWIEDVAAAMLAMIWDLDKAKAPAIRPGL